MIEWTEYNGIEYIDRDRAFSYPRMFPELIDNDYYWNIIRILKADFVPEYNDSECVIKIVSLANGDRLPVVGKINLSENEGKHTIESITLYPELLTEYKLIDYIGEVVRVALFPFSTSCSSDALHTVEILIDKMKENPEKAITVSGNFCRLLEEFVENDEYSFPERIPAFDNVSDVAFWRNYDDNIITKLLDLVDELIAKGFNNVWYYYSDTEEPIFVLEIPLQANAGEHGFIVLNRYKNRIKNVVAVVVNSDYVRPLPRSVAEKVIKYYESVLDYIAVEKAKVIKTLFEHAGIKINSFEELHEVIEIIEEEYAFGGFCPEDYDDKTVEFAFNIFRKISRSYKKLLSVLLPLSEREFEMLAKEYGFGAVSS